MNYYSLPADYKFETIDKFVDLNNTYENSKVLETYGNITLGQTIESGRPIDMLPKIDLMNLNKYVAYSKKQGIGFNYTLNASHMNNKEFTEEGVKNILNFIEQLHLIGVNSLTVTLPSVFEIIKATKHNFEIKISVICAINNANKAIAYKNLGAKRIVVDESINRNFKQLRNIVNAFGDKVEVIVNQVCNKNCIYRIFHYNQISSDSIKILNKTSVDYYSHRCLLQRYNHVSNILKMTWIRPEDIKFYNNIGINHFKLQGRQLVHKGDIVKTVEYYFKESFEGNLMDLIYIFNPTNRSEITVNNKKLDGFIKPFYENKHFCNNFCDSCKYCENFAKKCINEIEAKEAHSLAKGLCDTNDQLKNLIDLHCKEEMLLLKNGIIDDGNFKF